MLGSYETARHDCVLDSASLCCRAVLPGAKDFNSASDYDNPALVDLSAPLGRFLPARLPVPHPLTSGIGDQLLRCRNEQGTIRDHRWIDDVINRETQSVELCPISQIMS